MTQLQLIGNLGRDLKQGKSPWEQSPLPPTSWSHREPEPKSSLPGEASSAASQNHGLNPSLQSRETFQCHARDHTWAQGFLFLAVSSSSET